MRIPRNVRPALDPDDLRPGRHPTNRYQRERAADLHLDVPPDRTADELQRALLELDKLVLTALLSGLGPRNTVRAIQAQEGNLYSAEVVWQTINRIHREWRESADGMTDDDARAEQLECLRNDLARMRGYQRPNWHAIRGHEQLRAMIQGTLRPVRIKVDVTATLRESLASVLNDMTQDEHDAMVAEQLALEGGYRLLPTAAE